MVLTDLGFLTLIFYAWHVHKHICVCIATLPVEAVNKLGHTLVLWMHGANLSCMADYPDLLLSFRVVFQLVIAILADDVGQFLLAVVQSWMYDMASTLFFFLPLYFVFLMSFSVPEFCVYAQYT